MIYVVLRTHTRRGYIRCLVYCDLHHDYKPYKLNTHDPNSYHNATIIRCLFLSISFFNWTDEYMKTTHEQIFQWIFSAMMPWFSKIRSWYTGDKMVPLPGDCIEMSFSVTFQLNHRPLLSSVFTVRFLNTINKVFTPDKAANFLLIQFSAKMTMQPIEDEWCIYPNILLDYVIIASDNGSLYVSQH